MKWVVTLLLFAVGTNAWAGCRIWPADECKSYADSKYGVYLDGNDATGLCHSWDQAISRVADLNGQGLCGHRGRAHCRPALAATECSNTPESQYGVYADNYDATGLCHTWAQAISRIGELRSSGVCR